MTYKFPILDKMLWAQVTTINLHLTFISFLQFNMYDLQFF